MTFDSPEWREQRDELIGQWLNYNLHARDFLIDIGHAFEVWDDLIDRDKPVSDEAINGAFVRLLFDLPTNPFYAANAAYLRPLLMAGVNAWLDSTVLEKEGTPWATVWAYALRDWYMEIVPACAFLIGGFEHMRRVSLEARRFFQAETLEEYKGPSKPTTQPPTFTKVWLKNAKGEELHNPKVLQARNGESTFVFKPTSDFSTEGTVLYMESDFMVDTWQEPINCCTRVVYPDEELRVNWGLV